LGLDFQEVPRQDSGRSTHALDYGIAQSQMSFLPHVDRRQLKPLSFDICCDECIYHPIVEEVDVGGGLMPMLDGGLRLEEVDVVLFVALKSQEESFVSCVDVVRHSQCSILIVLNGVRDLHFLPSSAKLCSVRDGVLGTLTSFFPNPNRLPCYEMFVRSFELKATSVQG